MGIPKAGWWSSPKPEDSAASRELATEASAARGSRIQQATGSSPTSRGRPPQPDPRRVGSSGLAEVSEPGAPAPTTNRDRGQRFVCNCDLQFERYHPERAGVPVRPLVERLY